MSIVTRLLRGSVINNSVNKMGIGAICQKRNNNIEAVLIDDNQIIHYWHEPGKGWNRGTAY